MRLKKAQVTTLMAVAAFAGLTGQSFAQYTFVNSNQLPYAGTDDTATNNSLTYGGNALNNNLGYGNVAGPQANLPGSGAPFVVSALTNTTLLAHGSITIQTDSYLDNSGGIHYFGQFNPSTTLQYQNSGSTYSTQANASAPILTFPQNYHLASVYGENSQGVVAANEEIEAPDATSNGALGQNAFLFNIGSGSYTTLGLSGLSVAGSNASYGVNVNYSNTAGGTSPGTYASSGVLSVDNAGNADGKTNRYYAFGGVAQSSASSSALGTSTWYYKKSDGSTTETGLYGPGYSFKKTFSDGGTGLYVSNSNGGTNGGYSVGTTTPYVDLGNGTTNGQAGTEAWEYSAATGHTTAISMYQAGQTPTLHYVSGALSYSYTTSVANGSGTYRSSKLGALNANGLVGASSNYYYAGTSTSPGSIAWIYNPANTSYTQVGLTNNGFAAGGTQSFVKSSTSAESSTIYAINTAGASTGTSTQYLSTGAGGAGTVSTNTVAWYTPANSSASIQIGPSDSNHLAVSSATGNYITDSVFALTDQGLVAGSATRYTPGTTTTNGQDGFIYDANTGQTMVVDPNPASTAYFNSTISYIAPNGVAVGTFKTSASGTPHAFIWSAYSGFKDLSTSTTGYGSGVATNLSYITNAYSYDPGSGSVFVQANFLYNGAAYFTNGVYSVIKAAPIATSAPVVTASASAASGVSTGPVGSGGGTGSVAATFTSTSPGSSLTVNYNPSLSEADLVNGTVSGIAPTGATPFALPTTGDQLEAWDVQDTGTYAGLITLVFHYDPSLLAPGTDPTQLEIYHYDGGGWTLPAGEVVDTTANTITVNVSSLSPFVLGLAPAAVPEPVTLGLLLPAAAAGLLRRRKRA
jgi:hypothetical protein